MEWVYFEIFGNTAWEWLLAVGISAATLLTIRLVSALIARHFRPVALRTPLFIDDAIVTMAETTNLVVLAPPALYLGAQSLALPPPLALWLRIVAMICLLIQIAIWGSALIGRWVERYREQNLETNAAAVGTTRVLSFIARLVLFSVLLLLALDNLPGVEITALVASLGIGGIAVALAVQNILGDLFASVSIVLDKPFAVGEFIIVGSELGTVKEIGLKTTRVTSLGGEEISFANADLLNSRIRNYTRMRERRVVFTFSVPYDTPVDKVAEIPNWVRSIIEGESRARFDRAHLSEFGPHALMFEVVYYVLSPDFNVHMDVRQGFNLALMRRFAADDITFALPTHTILMPPTRANEQDDAEPREDRIIATGPR